VRWRAAARLTPGFRCIYRVQAGLISIPPTTGLGNRHLIRVAVAWDHGQALPLWGSFIGAATSFIGMDVNVRVTETPVLPRGTTPAADPSPVTLRVSAPTPGPIIPGGQGWHSAWRRHPRPRGA